MMVVQRQVDELLQRSFGPCRGTDLDSLIEFEVFCGEAEGKSDKTIALTVLALRKFKAFLEQEGMSTDAAIVSDDDMRRFILHLRQSRRFDGHPYAHIQEKGLSDLSIDAYLRALRAAWNRWVNEGLVDGSPFDRVRLPRPSEKEKPVLSDQQIDDLFAAIDTSTPAGYRDFTLLSLLIDTGCRLSEVTRAKVADLDLRTGHLRVMGKGRRERTVPIGVTARKLLWKYLNVYRAEPLGLDGDYIFLTAEGRLLTKNRVEAIVRRYAGKAGIQGPWCTPHGFRRVFCVRWIRNGGDIFRLQRITGHRDLGVLRRYAVLDQSDVDDAHKKFSPLDNLRARGMLAPKAVKSTRKRR